MFHSSGGRIMESVSAMAARQVGDSWTWFCGGAKSPSGDGNIYKNCTSCLNSRNSLTGPFSSVCVQHAIVCFGQLLLLLIFFALLVLSKSIPPGALTSAELLSTFEVGSVLYNVTSVLSVLVGLANAALGAHRLGSVPAIAAHEEIYLLVQGVAWITIAISLRIRLLNPAKQVAYMWWILTFFLTTLATVLSLIDLYNRATSPSLEVYLAVASWPVGCLLLACAIRGERWIAIEPDSGLSEPLLNSAPNGAANDARELNNTVETF